MIEKGWFEQQTTGNINERDMPGMAAAEEVETEAEEPVIIDAHYEEVTHEDLYGAPQSEAPANVPQIEQQQEMD